MADIKIFGTLHNVTGEALARADEIYYGNKTQSEVNIEIAQELDNRYTKNETYSQSELESMITPPEPEYIAVNTYAELQALTTHPNGAIYRVAHYDGTQVDNTKFAEYSWTGSEYKLLAVRGNALEPLVGYYECTTAAATAAKTITASNYVLTIGGSIKIKMTNANTADNATLNIQSTGAKPLFYDGQRASSSNTWEAGETIEVYYDGTNFMANNVAGGGDDGVFDVSEKYPTSGVEGGNTYTLEGALAVLNTNLPASKKKGGMSIEFIQSSDNKYVQYRLMATTWSTNESDWQGVDDEPTAGSENLVKSGGVDKKLFGVAPTQVIETPNFGYIDIHGQHQPSSNHNYSNPFTLKAGQLLLVINNGMGYSCISSYDSINDSYTNIEAATTNVDEYKAYKYSSTEDKAIVVSLRKGDSKAMIFDKTVINELNDKCDTNSANITTINTTVTAINTHIGILKNVGIILQGGVSNVGVGVKWIVNNSNKRCNIIVKGLSKIICENGYYIHTVAKLDNNFVCTELIIGGTSISEYNCSNSEQYYGILFKKGTSGTDIISVNDDFCNIIRYESSYCDSTINETDNGIDISFKNVIGTILKTLNIPKVSSSNMGLITPELYDTIKDIYDNYPKVIETADVTVYPEFEIGSITSTGEENQNTDRRKSVAISLSNLVKVGIRDYTKFEYWIRVFDDNGFLGNMSYSNILSVDITASNILNSFPNATYIILVAKRAEAISYEIWSSFADYGFYYIKKDNILIVPSLWQIFKRQNTSDTKEQRINIEYGGLDGNGKIENVSDRATFFNKFRTSKFIKDVDFGLSLTNCSAYVYKYDADFNYIGKVSVTDLYTSEHDCAYIKLSGTITDTTVPHSVKLYAGEIDEVFNNRPSDDPISFVYEVTPCNGRDVMTDDANITQYDTAKYYNSGILKLPSSYMETGTPTRLIFWAHGSGHYGQINTLSFNPNYNPYIEYLQKEGYAIFDCFGGSSKYMSLSWLDAMGSPTNMSCINAAYKWIVKNYNICTDGIYVSGKSLGGVICANMLYNKSIPVLAVCPLAPALDMRSFMLGYTAERRAVYCEDMGFVNYSSITDSTFDSKSSSEKRTLCDAVITENIDKLIAYDGVLRGVIEDKATIATMLATNNNYASLKKMCNVPIKIFIAPDDSAVSYNASKNFIAAIKNLGGDAELRTMPSNTGGHHAVDTDENALKVASITTKLGYVCTNIPLAWVEMVQFFRRY